MPPRVRFLRGPLAGVLFAAFLAFVLTGCSGAPPPLHPPTSVPTTIPAISTEIPSTVGGLARSSLVRSPAHRRGERLPVVVALHGAGGDGRRFEEGTGFTRDIHARRFIAVYPNGTPLEGAGLAWNAGLCCGRPERRQVDDIGFLRTVLDTLEKRFDADRHRVYLAGFSNGGMLAYRAACELGSRIAGIAVVSGALNVRSCPSAARMPLVIVHGTADRVVPYGGGLPLDKSRVGLPAWTNASVADAVKVWTARNGCSSSARVSMDGVTRDIRYLGCSGGTFVEVRTIEGGAHHWPVGTAALIEARFLNAR